MAARTRTSLVLLALLAGGASGDPMFELSLSSSLPWYATAGGGRGPLVTVPCPGEERGWKFEFEAGSAWSAGYAEVPLDGERLAGLETVEIEYQSPLGGEMPDLVLGTSSGAYRAALPTGQGSWSVAAIRCSEFEPFPGTETPPDRARFRYLRFETPDHGFAERTVLDVRGLVFRGNRDAVGAQPARSTDAETEETPEALRAEPGEFLCGLFLLGGNRSLLQRIGTAGANVVVEYGPNTWPRVVVEDYLDYDRCTGIRMAPSVTRELDGRILVSDARLLPLGSHPALFAWYLFDEPDGGTQRGLPEQDVSPQILARRRALLQPAPTLITCLDGIGLSRYVQSADFAAIDCYLPAGGPERPLATIHSAAESVVEIAREANAQPLIVLQLAHPEWSSRGQIQDPASLRSQVYAALAAGVRGVLFFQGAATVRAAEDGQPGGALWQSFLEISAEMAALSPLATRWTRIPGEPQITSPIGEVRASCFQEGGEHWIVLVNLSRREPKEVRLTGECLRGAERLEEPPATWSTPVSSGECEVRLQPLEAHLARVIPADEQGDRPRPDLVLRLPAPALGDNALRFNRAVVGGTLFPAPDGPIKLMLDGEDRTEQASIYFGPGAAVRLPVSELAAGLHRVSMAWRHDGEWSERDWLFEVDPGPALPFVDDFQRGSLGSAWGRCDDVIWNYHDVRELPAAGTIDVVDGELEVRSTGGGLGVVIRHLEAPETFRFAFSVRLAEAGEILVDRNSVFQKLSLPAGRSQVEVWEEPGLRTFRVNGTEQARWEPPIDHRGGQVGLGVPGGGRALFDNVELSVP